MCLLPIVPPLMLASIVCIPSLCCPNLNMNLITDFLELHPPNSEAFIENLLPYATADTYGRMLQ